MEKIVLFSMSWGLGQEKVSERNQTYDLPGAGWML